ncbi:MAG TPA: c-type cytochrome [Humisphaera sp.]
MQRTNKRLVTALAVLSAIGFSAAAGLIRSASEANAQAAPAAPAAAGAVTPAASAVPAANRPDFPELKADEKDAPGVAVTFFPAGSEDKPAAGDTRAARMLALYVPAGAPASPFVAPGPFSAVFDGALNLRLRDTYTFSATGRGKVVVTVNDKKVLEAEGDDLAAAAAGEGVRLNKGKNKITVRYTSPAAGDAAFRLLWTVKGDSFPYPIPPASLTHNAGAEAVAKGELVREGRFLVADLRCTRCHTTPEMALLSGPTSQPTAAWQRMPEATADAPDLSSIGSRLNKDWVAAWVNNPHALRPTAHMPRLFAPAAGGDDAAIDPRAADVAAYLATLAGAAPTAKFESTDEKVALGGQLFTHLNCIVCHEQPGAQANAAGAAPGAAPEPDPNADPTDAPPVRVPLKLVKAKYQPAALVEFLKNPAERFHWIRMPNFKFTDAEAEAVAAFLLSEASGELPANPPAGDPAKGKAFVASAGCINCHQVGQERTAGKFAGLNDIPKDGWTRGCLAPDDAGRKAAPKFELTEAQRRAIVAFASTDRASLYRDHPAEFAARQVKALNCNGCHARDGKESLMATTFDAEHKDLEGKYPAPKGDHAEAFSPDQRAPLMTWFGEKLRPEWTAAFVAGDVKYKPRPYLHARMPVFASRALNLAHGLAAEHGVGTSEPAPPKPDPELAAVGSKLAGKAANAAFQCTQCHAVAKNPPFAPFEAPAVNFSYSAERLRKDYYHRWIHNPLALDPNTKMPAFEREGEGKTTITAFYDGDARKQFEAIWQYLLSGKDIKPPAE